MRPRSPDKVSKVRTLLLGYSKSPNMQVVCFETKYKTKNKEVLAYNADPVTLLLKLGKRERGFDKSLVSFILSYDLKL